MNRSAARSSMVGALVLALVGMVAGVAAAKVSPSEQGVMLAAHNGLRQSVAASESARLGRLVTIPDLTWNADAAAVAQAWADNLLATGADAIATGNIGCLTQIDFHLGDRRKAMPTRHTVEFLA